MVIGQTDPLVDSHSSIVARSNTIMMISININVMNEYTVIMIGVEGVEGVEEVEGVEGVPNPDVLARTGSFIT